MTQLRSKSAVSVIIITVILIFLKLQVKTNLVSIVSVVICHICIT